MSMRTPSLDSYTSYSSFARGASRAHEAGVRSQNQLKRALAEIDGLFAGLNYLDTAEPCQPRTPESPSQTPASEYPDDLQLELESISPEPNVLSATQNTGDSASQRRDWSAIRNVRDGMEVAWKAFDELATKLNIDVIKNIREQYGNAKGLRETGVYAFRNTVTGPAPNSLEKIFAFTSLSYVVSCLLRDRQRLGDSDVLDGIQIWCNAIQIQEERDAFIRVAELLWPEALNHLHTIPLSISEDNRRKITELQSQDKWADLVRHNLEACNNTNVSGAPDVSWGETSNTVLIPGPSLSSETDLFNPWSACPEALENHVYQMTNETERALGFSAFLLDEREPPDINKNSTEVPVTATGTASMVPLDTGQGNRPADSDIPMGDNPSASGSSKDTKVSKDELRKTKLFEVLLIFFRCFDTFLYDLSGAGITSSKNLQQLFAYHEKPRMKELIYEHLLKRLLTESYSKDLRYQAIVNMTESFVKLGWLQEVEDVQTYLLFIGKKLISDSSYKQFSQWVSASKDTRENTLCLALPSRRLNGGIVKKHAPARYFFCSFCGKKLTTKFNMKRHQRDIHTSRAQNPSLTPIAAHS